MSKYDFIYLFPNLLSLIFLNGPSGGKKAHGGENPQGNSVGGLMADLGGPNGTMGLAHQGLPHKACGISPTLPGWQVGSPLGAYIKRGTPGLLIQPINSQFSLDFVISFVGVAPS